MLAALRQDKYQGLWFAAPALLVLAALIVYPLVYTGVMSVTNQAGHLVGWRNYATILRSSTTSVALRNTLLYVVASVVLQLVLGTLTGVLLDRRFRGRALLRSALLIPWIIPGIVAATVWAWMFHSEFGILNYILVSLHMVDAPVGWLTEPHTVMPAMIAINTWKMFPFVAVMVLAGLQAIPATLYEAARIDGAGFWGEVRFIMLPQLRAVLLSLTLLLTIWGLNGITIIYAITKGGPANLTLITPIQIYRQAFEFFQLNQAAALSVAFFLVVLVLTVLYLSVSGRHEEDA